MCVCASVVGEQARRHLFLTEVRADSWQAHRCHSGGEELKEDGRRWTLRLVSS